MDKYYFYLTRMSSLFGCSLAIFFCGIANASAQNLSYHYYQALENNASYEASIKRHQATLELEEIASSTLWPTLSASATETRITGDSMAADIDNSTQSLTLSYNVRAEVIPARNAAQAAIQKSSNNLTNAKQTLIVNTVDNYFAVVKNQINIASLLTQQKSAEQSLAKIRKQLELGLVNSVAVAEVENNLQRLNLTLLQAKQSLYQSQTNLAISTGVSALQTLVGIAYNTKIPELSNTDFDHWWEIAQLNSPLLKSQQHDVTKAYYDYQQIRYQHFPTFGINATLDNNSKKTISMSLSGNLFEGGLTYNRAQQAQYNWQASQADLRASTASLRQQIANLLFSLRNHKVQIALYQSLLASSQVSLEATQAEYDLGLKELVDVLTAQQDVANNAVNLEASRYDLLILQANIKQVTGILRDTDLQAFDALLDMS